MTNDTNGTQDSVQQYFEDRLDQYRSWYDRKSVEMKKKHQRTQVISAIGAVLVPVINNISIAVPIGNENIDISKLSVTIIGLLVALAIAIEGVYHYENNGKTIDQQNNTWKHRNNYLFIELENTLN
jgi:uncharacterized membrane protein YidH (DUF202 family)